MAFVFNKCCCCIDLRTGSFIIGYLNLIIILIVIALNVLTIVISIEESSGSMYTSTQEQADYIVFVASCVMMVLLAIFLIFIIVLLVGLHKEKHGHVKAYLIFAAILGTLFILEFVALTILIHMPVWRIILDIASFILNGYFLICLKSYYLRMDSSMKTTTYNMNIH